MENTGSNLYDKINTRMGKGKYILGVLADKANPNQENFDCAELASWGVYQVGGFLYGCANNSGNPKTADAYTGFWQRDAIEIGKIVTIDKAKATKGAFLLRVAANGAVGHIVCCDGKGGTAEANSTKYGMINSHVDCRRWDYGVEVVGFDFSEEIIAPSKPPLTKIYRWTTPMMVSAKIGLIQKQLSALGYYKLKVDNVYGEGTYKSVRAFQAVKGIVVDGEVGPTTSKELGLTL